MKNQELIDQEITSELTEEQKDFYFQNIKTMIMERNDLEEEDMDDDDNEDLVNRASNVVFGKIFGIDY